MTSLAVATPALDAVTPAREATSPANAAATGNRPGGMPARAGQVMNRPHGVSRPGSGMPTRTALELLASARRGLAEAEAARVPALRYSLAHLATLRCAAAVLAHRARPAVGGRGRRPANAWSMLATVAPELAEWAAFFAAGAGKRAAAEAGLRHAVTAREADDLLRDAEMFRAVVETTLGFAHQPVLATSAVVG